MTLMNLEYLDDWARGLLADPVLKSSLDNSKYRFSNGILDTRIFLKNSYGYNEWYMGQCSYEAWESGSLGYEGQVSKYKQEIEYDTPIYDYFHITGDVLDVGGGAGTLRHFLSRQVRYISIDPFISAPFDIPPAKKEAYGCLSEKFNFISGMAEFLPFQENKFDWVHMRSMLDHVQVPDLALMEANRVLKDDGCLLVGLYVEGGKTGRKNFSEISKEFVKNTLSLIGISKYKDMHTWHPTFKNLIKLVNDNGFEVVDTFWQPHWRDSVVYVLAKKQKFTACN